MILKTDGYGRVTSLTIGRADYACMECGRIIRKGTKHIAQERDAGMPKVRYCVECKKELLPE